MSAGRTPESACVQPADSQQEARRQLRREGIARRQALSAEQLAGWSAAVAGHLAHAFPELATQRVAFCWPINNEPDLRPLLRRWLAAGTAGCAALLPVVVGAGQPLAFRAWHPEMTLGHGLVADRYGIPAPVAGEFLVPQALLIPLNAFDGDGYRLGYGGGFFDRTLAALAAEGGSARPPLAIGVGFELARAATIHPQAHDRPLDAVVTEAGVFRTHADGR